MLIQPPWQTVLSPFDRGITHIVVVKPSPWIPWPEPKDKQWHPPGGTRHLGSTSRWQCASNAGPRILEAGISEPAVPRVGAISPALHEHPLRKGFRLNPYITPGSVRHTEGDPCFPGFQDGPKR
jgi:hypothetical protein